MEELCHSRVLLNEVGNFFHLGELGPKSETFQSLFAAHPFHNVFSRCTDVFANSMRSKFIFCGGELLLFKRSFR